MPQLHNSNVTTTKLQLVAGFSSDLLYKILQCKVSDNILSLNTVMSVKVDFWGEWFHILCDDIYRPMILCGCTLILFSLSVW